MDFAVLAVYGVAALVLYAALWRVAGHFSSTTLRICGGLFAVVAVFVLASAQERGVARKGAVASFAEADAEATQAAVAREALEELAAGAPPSNSGADAHLQKALIDAAVEADRSAAKKGRATEALSKATQSAPADRLSAAVRRASSIDVGLLGWMLLGVVAVVSYRRLEVVNARRDLSWVVVEPVVGEGDEKAAPRRTARLHYWLATAKVHHPATTPGGEQGEALAAVLGASEETYGKLASSLVKLVQAVAIPRRGTTVEAAYRVENSCHLLAVHITSNATGELLSANELEGSSEDDVLRRGAYFVAATVLSRSKIVPSWAQWEAFDGAGFAAYQLVALDEERSVARLTAARRKEHLMEALRASPSSPLARLSLGQLYELEEKQLDALELYLEAAYSHPRFVAAQTRAAAALAMMAEEETIKKVKNDPRLFRVLGLLRRAKLGEPATDNPKLPGFASDVADCFLVVARSLLKRAERVAGWSWYRLPALLRQDERSYWLPLIRDGRYGRWEQNRLQSLQILLDLRLQGQTRLPRQDERPYWLPLIRNGRYGRWAQDRLQSLQILRTRLLSEEIPLDRRAKRMAALDDLGATARYNMACYYSLASRPAPNAFGQFDSEEARKRAVDLLYEAASRQQGPRPGPEWVTVDPDLEPLQNDPGFREFISWLQRPADIQGAFAGTETLADHLVAHSLGRKALEEDFVEVAAVEKLVDDDSTEGLAGELRIEGLAGELRIEGLAGELRTQLDRALLTEGHFGRPWKGLNSRITETSDFGTLKKDTAHDLVVVRADCDQWLDKDEKAWLDGPANKRPMGRRVVKVDSNALNEGDILLLRRTAFRFRYLVAPSARVEGDQVVASWVMALGAEKSVGIRYNSRPSRGLALSIGPG